jgi:hypothetical protein
VKRQRPRTPIELLDSIVDCDNRTRRAATMIAVLTGSIASTVLAAGLFWRISPLWVTSLAVTGLVAVAKMSRRRARGDRSD